jgi:hypothetical protein
MHARGVQARRFPVHGDAAWHYESSPAIDRARKQGCKVVLMVHDLIPLRHPEFCSPLVTNIFDVWLRGVLPLADMASAIPEPPRMI